MSAPDRWRKCRQRRNGWLDVCKKTREGTGFHPVYKLWCGASVDALAGHAYYVEFVAGGHDAPPGPRVREVPPHDPDGERSVVIRMNTDIRKAVEKYLAGQRPTLIQDDKGYWK